MQMFPRWKWEIVTASPMEPGQQWSGVSRWLELRCFGSGHWEKEACRWPERQSDTLQYLKKKKTRTEADWGNLFIFYIFFYYFNVVSYACTVEQHCKFFCKTQLNCSFLKYYFPTMKLQGNFIASDVNPWLVLWENQQYLKYSMPLRVVSVPITLCLTVSRSSGLFLPKCSELLLLADSDRCVNEQLNRCTL